MAARHTKIHEDEEGQQQSRTDTPSSTLLIKHFASYTFAIRRHGIRRRSSSQVLGILQLIEAMPI
jgi:hypothetical protein